MSITIMAQVWNNTPELSGNVKLVLLALADRANDEGVCWPGQATLAKKCGISRKLVNEILQDLEAKKYISRSERYLDSGGRTSDLITISIPPCNPVVTPPCNPGITPPVTPGLHDSSVDTSIDSSKDISAKPKPAEKKSSRSPDTRSSHPAIKAMKTITQRYPNLVLYDRIIEALGDNPNLDLLRRCREEWIARGYNPNSINWLDWYKSGGPQSAGGKGKARPMQNNPAQAKSELTLPQWIEARDLIGLPVPDDLRKKAAALVGV